MSSSPENIHDDWVYVLFCLPQEVIGHVPKVRYKIRLTGWTPKSTKHGKELKTLMVDFSSAMMTAKEEHFISVLNHITFDESPPLVDVRANQCIMRIRSTPPNRSETISTVNIPKGNNYSVSPNVAATAISIYL